MKKILIICFLMPLIFITACQKDSTIDYFKLVTNLKNLESSKVIFEFDNLENYKFCIIQLDSIKAFKKNNAKLATKCKAINAYWNYYFKEKVNKVADTSCNLCFQGEYNKVKWNALLNMKSGEILIEAIYPDYSGQ